LHETFPCSGCRMRLDFKPSYVRKAWRTGAEHLLKIGSWSVLVAAVRYLAQKSGEWRLSVCGWILGCALIVYIYSLIADVELQFFPDADRQSGRRFWLTALINVIGSLAVYMGLIYLSSALIVAFVQAQSQK
jgi:predicted cobalt transporter CbtA